jgi:hypothetical protein
VTFVGPVRDTTSLAAEGVSEMMGDGAERNVGLSVRKSGIEMLRSIENDVGIVVTIEGVVEGGTLSNAGEPVSAIEDGCIVANVIAVGDGDNGMGKVDDSPVGTVVVEGHTIVSLGMD